MNLSDAVISQATERAHLLNENQIVLLDSPLAISLDVNLLVAIGSIECAGRLVIIGMPRDK